MFDYILKPMGKSLIKDPELMDRIQEQMNASQDSPMMARAPLLLAESMLFPYREGLSFEQDVWMDEGQKAAFTGTLDRPPTSSWEILNPREYEKKHVPSVPILPDIHPLVDALYKPYDIGQVGQLDVRILTELFGGVQEGRDLTSAWDGGLYWAGQRLNATPAEQATTNSIGLLYLSVWKSAASAQDFARLYAEELGRKYSGVKLGRPKAFKVFPPPPTPPEDEPLPPISSTADEQVYTTAEGPVVITTRGKMVFVAESFPLELARKLATLILDAQGSGATLTAQKGQPAPTLSVILSTPSNAKGESKDLLLVFLREAWEASR